MNPADRWRTTGSHLGAALPAPLPAELLAAYAEPHRTYHTLQHLAECFGQLDASPTPPEDPASLELALSILGAPAARFDEYAAQVRIEYGWASDPDYRSARGRILRGFLDRPMMFQTPHFEGLFEDRARANLARSLAQLAPE